MISRTCLRASSLRNVCRKESLVALQPIQRRWLTSTTACRFNAETQPPKSSAKEIPREEALVLTPYQKVSGAAKGTAWLTFLGLVIVGVAVVFKQLLPNRMSPNGLFSEALDILSSNTDVTTRIGMPVHGYGKDVGRHREGRRNQIEHMKLKTADDKNRLRIKFNIKGPEGHAFVFAEVNEDMKKGEYVYLIVQFTRTNELVKIQDNRHILQASSKEEADALRQLLGGN